MDKNQMHEFINAMGVIAETTLLFYRNLIEAGAKVDEASKLTEIFIRATMLGGNSGSKPSDNKES